MKKKLMHFFFFFASHEHLHELISILTVLANFVSGFSGQQFFFNTARVQQGGNAIQVVFPASKTKNQNLKMAFCLATSKQLAQHRSGDESWEKCLSCWLLLIISPLQAPTMLSRHSSYNICIYYNYDLNHHYMN